jgi:hypothetical protein
MFKTHYPKEVMEKWKRESTEDAIARGVEVEKIGAKVSGKRKKKVNTEVDYNLIPKDIRELLDKK